MPTFVSENLNEPEVVNKGATNMTGYSLSNTGVETRHVEFRNGDADARPISVPPGSHVTSPGNLLQSFPSGLTIASLVGDGTLIANVDWEAAGGEVSTAIEAPELDS